MKGHKILFSKKSDSWATPKDFYDELNEEFHFNKFDPCPINPKFDGLKENWIGRIFINPPYSNVAEWIQKGIIEMHKGNADLLVYLVPARTDTKWFHEKVYGKAELRFIKGRLKFGDQNNSAPFPSMLVIFKKDK